MWYVELVLNISDDGGICHTLSSSLEYSYLHLFFPEKYELLFKDIDWIIHGNKEIALWMIFF